MSTLDTILFRRRTIHEYTDEPVPEGAVERALHAAQMAPCHKLTWPWRFIRVGPRTRSQLAELTVAVKGQRRTMTDDLEAKIRRRTLNPAELLAVAQVRCDRPKQAREDYAAVAMALQNLSLSLEQEGCGTKWSTGAVVTHPTTYELLQVDPELQELVGFVWIGRAAETPEPPSRPPLTDVVRSVP